MKGTQWKTLNICTLQWSLGELNETCIEDSNSRVSCLSPPVKRRSNWSNIISIAIGNTGEVTSVFELIRLDPGSALLQIFEVIERHLADCFFHSIQMYVSSEKKSCYFFLQIFRLLEQVILLFLQMSLQENPNQTLSRRDWGK